MVIQKDERINILKTSNKYINCIEDHKALIDKKGLCWMARIGRDVNSQPIVNKNNYLFLYQRGALYLAHSKEIIKEQPSNGFPDSYKKYVFSGRMIPTEYLLLDFLEPIAINILDFLRYEGNHRIVSETITRSPKAYVVTRAIEDIDLF